MVQPPVKIRALRGSGLFEIQWSEGERVEYPFHFLRCECPCAACVNEFTGERILKPESVPTNIEPVEISFSGNYALKIEWNDGHNTGIYTWEQLDRLREAPEIRATDDGR